MSENTSIEWCDHTWTPVVGCNAISPACANCYAALMAARLEAMGNEKYRGIAIRVGGKAKWTGKVNFSEADLIKPLQVRKPGRWFLTSMGDVAHDAITDDQVAEMFGVMAVAGATGAFHREQDGYTPQKGSDGKVLAKWPNMLSGPHTFMVLTKRPARLAALLLNSSFRRKVSHAAYRWAHNRVTAGGVADGIYPDWSDFKNEPTQYWPMPNVFIGCTAEDQTRADELRPHMGAISARGWKTFVSYEPALGRVDWSGWEFLNQLISGGESGHKARPSHPDWHREARDFCEAAGMPYLFKQHGEWANSEAAGLGLNDCYEKSRSGGWVELDGSFSVGEHAAPLAGSAAHVFRIGKKAAGRLLDGIEHNGFPM